MNDETMKAIGKPRDVYKQKSSPRVAFSSLSLHSLYGSARIQATSGQEAIGHFGKT